MFERKNVIDSNAVALGCSHTWGVGVEANETWSYLLNARNFGEPGCSTDFLVRHTPDIIKNYQPKVIYILYPDWTRFEIVENNTVKQSLPTDPNRIYFMATHDENWLKENFANQAGRLKSICQAENIQLVEMTLYNLIPYIDHVDRWPVSKLGHHFGPVWHKWVADIFRELKENNTQLELAYE